MSFVRYHPVYLDLNGKPVLIVGGGYIGLEKLNSLLPNSGALITVVAPWIRDEVREFWEQGRIQWIERAFEPDDIEPYFMIIAATNDPAVNAEIFRLGNAKLRLTNSVDDPINCNFIMAAIVGEGPMQAAISSAGCSPALAQRARNRIAQEIITPQVGALAEYLGSWRAEVKASLRDFATKKEFWDAVVDSEAPCLFALHGPVESDKVVRRILDDFIARQA